MKSCENCSLEHDGTYGSGRFCCSKCARSFSTKNKRNEINRKVSKSLAGRGHGKIKLICENCKNQFEVNWSKRNQKTCSCSCSSSLKWENEEYKTKMSIISSNNAYERHKNDDKTFGWKTRKKLEPSYPEKVTMRVLDSLNIQYEYEMPLERYYVDFAIHDRKIAIEIDGKQHDKPERIITDKLKDELLIKNGWVIYRIKWPKDNIIESIQKIFSLKYSHL
jgi:very-short-patch-repair endonuclease